MQNLSIENIRKDFPLLQQKVEGRPLIYLDNAATTQKPIPVIRTVENYYTNLNANIHRGAYALSDKATHAFENVRKKVQSFIHARDAHEIVFVSGATEAINLVAHSFGLSAVNAGDEIIISELEHHSNIVPWQLLCERTGAVLKVIPINDAGEVDLDRYAKLLNARTKLVAVAHISNSLGTVLPIKKIIEMAHAHGVPVLIDGAQAVSHVTVDVQALDCDFYVFSAHKLFGPTGVGVLYGKAEWLEKMQPYQAGGGMVQQVSFSGTRYKAAPYKFEAGTPNIAGVVGLGAAIEYVEKIGFDQIVSHEHELLEETTQGLMAIPGVRLIGTAALKTSIISFVMKEIHPHDISTILDNDGIAIRAGHHCAMPVMTHFNVPATARISFSFYNTQEEVASLIKSIHAVKEVFA